MPLSASALANHLTVRIIDTDMFEGDSINLGWNAIFGGQVLGQSLMSAYQTTDRQAHSFHAYFLASGDVTRPVRYHVERVRDGGSFSTRRVIAKQDERVIYCMEVSFQKLESGLTHSVTTALSSPEEATSIAPLLRAAGEAADDRIELRVHELDGERHVWMRAALPTDDQRMHQAVLAYTSDFAFLTAALRPHGVDWRTPGLHIASLDHVMYFHAADINVREWVSHVVTSPWAGAARGLAQGRYFDQAGKMLASTMQEGLMRMPKA